MRKILLIFLSIIAFSVNIEAQQPKLQRFTTTHNWIGRNREMWGISKQTAPGEWISAYVEDGKLYACNHALHRPDGSGKTLRLVFIYIDNNGNEQRLEKDVPHTDTDPHAAYYNMKRDRYLVCENVSTLEKLSYYEDYEYLRYR